MAKSDQWVVEGPGERGNGDVQFQVHAAHTYCLPQRGLHDGVLFEPEGGQHLHRLQE